MADQGFIKLPRELIDNPHLQDPETFFVYARLRVRAAWQDHDDYVQRAKRVVSFKRGQLWTTIRQLAEECRLDRSKIHRILKRLKTATLIETEDETAFTRITICNYDENLSRKNDVRHFPRQQSRHARDTDKELQEKQEKPSSPNPSTDAEGDDQGADSNSGLGKDRSGPARARRQPTVTRGWQVPEEVLKLPPACNLEAEEIEERRMLFTLKHDGSTMANPVGVFLKDLEAYCRFERGKPRTGNVVPLKPAEPTPRWKVEDPLTFADRAIQEYRLALVEAGFDRQLSSDDEKALRLQLIKVAGGADIAIGIRPDCMVDAEKFVMALAPEAMLTDKQRAAG